MGQRSILEGYDLSDVTRFVECQTSSLKVGLYFTFTTVEPFKGMKISL